MAADSPLKLRVPLREAPDSTTAPSAQEAK
jgi:hypothetical protein